MSAEAAVTEDALLGGQVRLRQPAAGYRVAIDPVVLAAAVPAGEGETVLDVGAGVGAASLCLAARATECRVWGIEIQRDLVRLAAENVALNGFEGRVEVMMGDLTQAPPRLAAGSFQHVMSNPPYLDADSGNLSPNDDKARATVETQGDLAEWVDFCVMMAKHKGSVTFIHRADRLDELLAHLRAKTGGAAVYPLWPTADRTRPAKRVIIQATKGGAGPLRLLPGMILHDGKGYTPEAEAILRHGAGLTL
jgi:FkbM family methyltransferase